MNSRKPTGQPTLVQSWRNKAVLGSNNHLRGSPSPMRGRGRSRGAYGSSGYTANNKTPGRGRGRGRGKNLRFSETVINLADDEDEFCQLALGQFELANSEIGKAFEAGIDAKEIPGFERAAGEVWIYPTNRPVRDYQFNMVNTALFHNTLVCLPTGLGKTFIAAVVMFNFHRWYPDEIIVFMAPTRPLVTQQLDACHNIVGINPNVTVELTGQTLPAKREALWREKKVFFLTPQVMQSDIVRESCLAQKVRCVVIDEAHKALGNHSYAQVISAIAKVNTQFRVLALSATPGNDVTAIQQVFKNLLISRVELRCENSPDVLPYVHDRKVETRVVSLDHFLMSVYEQIKEMFQVYTGKLMKQNYLPRNGSSFVSFQLLQARQRFRTCPPPQLPPHERNYVEITFHVCISLARAIDLLNYHGLRSFYSFLHGLFLGEKGSKVVASELKKTGVDDVLTNIQRKLNISVENSSFNISKSALFDTFNESDCANVVQNPSSNLEDYLQSHPKMRVLKDLVTQHFEAYSAENNSTKIMIFSQYRDSVQEIGNMLSLLNPGTIKPMVFMGQAKTAGAGGRGLKQKEQIQVVEKFKKGGYNVLVATSVGEEGLDIGEVDLIICFDSNKSPTRNVQRMGRTGRQRQGKIIFLLTQGKEERLYRASIAQQSSINKTIVDPAKLEPFLFKFSPRMVPIGLEPECFKMNIILSSEQESYSHKRKRIGDSVEDGEDQHHDDSDFMPPAKIGRKGKKKAKVTLPKKSSSSANKLRDAKKTGSSTSQKQADNQTLAQCLELMETRRSQNLVNSKPKNSSARVQETITIDDDNILNNEDQLPLNRSFDSQPIIDYHNFMDVDDDYEFLCTIFDVKEMTHLSEAPACIQVPVPEKMEISWKTEYNYLPTNDILLQEIDLVCLREKVESCIYLSSLQKYCKCGNINGAIDMPAEDNEFDADFPEDLDFDLATSRLDPKNGCLMTPLRKNAPLTEIQPVAQFPTPSPVRNLFPSPRISTMMQQRSPFQFLQGNSYTSGEGKTSTPVMYQFQKNDRLKPSVNDCSTVKEINKLSINSKRETTKAKTWESLDAGFILDENDPMFDDNDEWDFGTDGPNTKSSPYPHTQSKAKSATISPSASVGSNLSNLIAKSAPTVNHQLSSNPRKSNIDVVLCSDENDSSTASESEIDNMLVALTQSEKIKPKFKFVPKSLTNNGKLLGCSGSSQHGAIEKRDNILLHHTTVDIKTNGTSGRNNDPFLNVETKKLKFTSDKDKQAALTKSDKANSSNSSVEVFLTSPDIGLKRKFVFKKRTSANTGISPPLQTVKSAPIQTVKNSLETVGSSSNSTSRQSLTVLTNTRDPNHNMTSNKNNSFLPVQTANTGQIKEENPHEVYSRIYDDDIDCIPATSSDEDGHTDFQNEKNRRNYSPLTFKEVVKDDKDDIDFDSDETRWDPNERIPDSPSSTQLSKVRINEAMKPSKEENSNNVFSPRMQNFKLSSYRNLTSQPVQTKTVKVLNFDAVKPASSSCTVPTNPKSEIPRARLLQSLEHANVKTNLQSKPKHPVDIGLRIVSARRIKLPESLESFSSPIITPNNDCTSEATKVVDAPSKNINVERQSQNSFKHQALKWSSTILKAGSLPSSSSSPASTLGNISTLPSASKFKFKSSRSKLPESKPASHQTSLAIPSSRERPIKTSTKFSTSGNNLSQTPIDEEDDELLLFSSFKSPSLNARTSTPTRSLLSPENISAADADSPDAMFVRRSNNMKRRIIHSDERQPSQRNPLRTKKGRVRRNPFVLEEAAGTSDESSVDGDWDERKQNYGDDDDSFVVHHDDDEDDDTCVSSSQQQAMYLRSVKDVVPLRGGRVEKPLTPPTDFGGFYDETEYDLNDSFCTTEVEYAEVGVYTQCMIAAREQVDSENKKGARSTRRLRSRR